MGDNNIKENSKALTVLISEGLHREFKAITSSKGLKLKECIIEMIEDYVNKNK